MFPPPQEAPETHLTKLGQFLIRTGLHLYLKVFESGALASLLPALPVKRFFSASGSLASTFCSRGPGFFGGRCPRTLPAAGVAGTPGATAQLWSQPGPCGLSDCTLPWGPGDHSRALLTSGQRVALLGCLCQWLSQLALHRARLGAVKGHLPTTAWARSWALGHGLRSTGGDRSFPSVLIAISLDFSTVGERGVSQP